MCRFPPKPAYGIGFVLFLITLAYPGVGQAQGLQGLVDRCAGASESFLALCHQAGLALEGARGGVATGATLGSETPGSASTFGHRLRSYPRIALSGRVGLSRSTMVAPPEGYGAETGSREESHYLPSVHLVGTVGAFNGFSPSPTMGGVLSVDLLASLHGLFPSEDLGFEGGLWGWGLGARLGILRESFTLPGISISATRRWMGSTALGDIDDGGPAQVRSDLDVTSFRGVIGKDLLGIGLLAGMGWDRVGGNASLRVRISQTGPETMASSSGISSKRMVYFAGASMTFLIAQISTEVGYSKARNPVLPLSPGGSSFPSSGAYFGSLAFRLTF